MTFRVGQKIVCIKEPVRRIHDLGLPGFKKGSVYTITHFDEIKPYGLFLGVAELSPNSMGHIRGFRPVTDISVFTEILRKATKPARAPAMSQHHRGTGNG